MRKPRTIPSVPLTTRSGVPTVVRAMYEPASGNAAEAQSKYEEARSNWDKVAPAISAREAREQQLLFDSLGKKLKDGAPPKDVKSTVSGMLEELREDIARELR